MCRLCACETVCTWKALDRWLLQLLLNAASFSSALNLFYIESVSVSVLIKAESSSHLVCFLGISWVYLSSRHHLLFVWFRKAEGDQSFELFFFFFSQLFGGLWGKWQSCVSNIITPLVKTVHFPAWALYLDSKDFIWENVLSSILSYHCSVRSNPSIKEMLFCDWGQFLNSKNSIFIQKNYFYWSNMPVLKMVFGQTGMYF